LNFYDIEMLDRLCYPWGMEKKKNPKKDFAELAFDIVQQATGEKPIEELSTKNPHAVALGRLGGLKGGKARAEKLSKKKRSEIASKAAQTRWKKD
jgi:hypothetical protein